MPSGYRSGGVDFDDLFDPYVQGAKSITTGRRVAGVDLNQRYAHIQFGTKRADVGHRVNGTDVSNLWAAKGTAQYWALQDNISGGHEWPATSGTSTVMYSKAKLTFGADGNLYQYQEGSTSGTRLGYAQRYTDTWLTSGSVGQYQVRFRTAFIGSVPSGHTTGVTVGNGATDFVALSGDRSIEFTGGGSYQDADTTYSTYLMKWTVYVDLKHPDGTVETRSCVMGATKGT